ncbi:MAG: hypothetical protein WCI22_05055 [Actinomycetota bacterium]
MIAATRPLHHLEVRGVAERSDDPDFVVRDRIATKHGFADGGAFDPVNGRRVNVTIVPTRVIEH